MRDMSLIISTLILIAGFVMLVKGADWLIEGSSAIARSLGMSDLMIGLTIVAFGTSAPELLVNIVASIEGNFDIVMGDIIGSNIANTFLVLGIAAAISPLMVKTSTVWKEIPFNVLIGVVFFMVAGDALIDGAPSIVTRSDGIVLLAYFLIFLYYTFFLKRGNHEQHSAGSIALPFSLFLVFIGCILLPVGGSMVVSAASSMARMIGISNAFIGLTIVALGTSLPEVAAAVVAAWKGNADIAIGNVIGSNIFNISWILGLSAIIRPIAMTSDFTVDMLIVIASSMLIFYLVHTGPIHHRMFLFWKQREEHVLTRMEGIFLLLCYAAYVAFIAWRG
jgi:cation:H+ antiporter